jgi:hypothetical protein
LQQLLLLLLTVLLLLLLLLLTGLLLLKLAGQQQHLLQLRADGRSRWALPPFHKLSYHLIQSHTHSGGRGRHQLQLL